MVPRVCSPDQLYWIDSFREWMAYMERILLQMSRAQQVELYLREPGAILQAWWADGCVSSFNCHRVWLREFPSSPRDLALALKEQVLLNSMLVPKSCRGEALSMLWESSLHVHHTKAMRLDSWLRYRKQIMSSSYSKNLMFSNVKSPLISPCAIKLTIVMLHPCPSHLQSFIIWNIIFKDEVEAQSIAESSKTWYNFLLTASSYSSSFEFGLSSNHSKTSQRSPRTCSFGHTKLGTILAHCRYLGMWFVKIEIRVDLTWFTAVQWRIRRYRIYQSGPRQ